MSKAKQKKGAGRPSPNVTIDLGEAIEKKLRGAGLRTEVGKPPSVAGRTLGSYRPGMFGGFRPWYSRLNRPWMGQETAAPGRTFTLIPMQLQQLKTSQALTGVGLGLLGNRAIARLTPQLWKTQESKLVHEGIAFVAGLLPMVIKRNATTVGVAIPGAVYLGGSLVDALFDAVGIPAGPTLKGSQGAPRANASQEARQKLAAIQQRINMAQAQRPQNPRVVAQPQFA